MSRVAIHFMDSEIKQRVLRSEKLIEKSPKTQLVTEIPMAPIQTLETRRKR